MGDFNTPLYSNFLDGLHDHIGSATFPTSTDEDAYPTTNFSYLTEFLFSPSNYFTPSCPTTMASQTFPSIRYDTAPSVRNKGSSPKDRLNDSHSHLPNTRNPIMRLAFELFLSRAIPPPLLPHSPYIQMSHAWINTTFHMPTPQVGVGVSISNLFNSTFMAMSDHSPFQSRGPKIAANFKPTLKQFRSFWTFLHHHRELLSTLIHSMSLISFLAYHSRPKISHCALYFLIFSPTVLYCGQRHSPQS